MNELIINYSYLPKKFVISKEITNKIYNLCLESNKTKKEELFVLDGEGERLESLLVADELSIGIVHDEKSAELRCDNGRVEELKTISFTIKGSDLKKLKRHALVGHTHPYIYDKPMSKDFLDKISDDFLLKSIHGLSLSIGDIMFVSYLGETPYLAFFVYLVKDKGKITEILGCEGQVYGEKTDLLNGNIITKSF